MKYSRYLFSVVGFVAVVFMGVVGFVSIKSINQTVSAAPIQVEQEINEAQFASQQEFPVRIEQPDNTPFRILDARVSVISAENYQGLTGQRSPFPEVVSKPKMLLQNLSNKTIVGVTIMTVDKAAGTKFGLYMKNQSIKPGQRFSVIPENFVQVQENPARNPKFWMTVRDKSQVAVRVVAFFEDGSLWANN